MRVCLRCGQGHESEDWSCPACHHVPTRHLNFVSFAPEMQAHEVHFRPECYSVLAEVEQQNFWFQARSQLLIWALKAHFPTAQSLLEIGCGTGFVLNALHIAFPTLKLAGSEIFSEGLRYASTRAPQAMLFQMDARSIPFKDEFDIVGAFDVLEHIAEDDLVLQQMHQSVKPGGGIMVTVPQHPWLWSEYDTVDGHCRRYTRADLCQKVRAAGFQVVRVSSFVALLLPLLLVMRRMHTTNCSDSTKELRINSVVNGGLGTIMGVERWLIRAGFSFPMGGSLLLIARKPKA